MVGQRVVDEHIGNSKWAHFRDIDALGGSSAP
jgi:hypothetical protein